ncbi:Matrix metalloproteinase-17 [Holothuria leucospilota]|uniref:Matrix metalloproteinase-17 n=1 Tax=Holothuria leucospilota TaxID=206669 RepID=A0A9Q1CI72_HOLLE|nr:Matrix metalloproteinase-17 [Holothuria leucospilota]
MTLHLDTQDPFAPFSSVYRQMWTLHCIGKILARLTFLRAASTTVFPEQPLTMATQNLSRLVGKAYHVTLTRQLSGVETEDLISLKGSEYYRYNWDNDRVDSGYPISIAKGWPGVTSPVDAAFQWQNGRTYLFTGEKYYRYNDGQDRVDSGYPLITTKEWLGCEKSSPLGSEPKDMCYFA